MYVIASTLSVKNRTETSCTRRHTLLLYYYCKYYISCGISGSYAYNIYLQIVLKFKFEINSFIQFVRFKIYNIELSPS